MLFFNFIVKSNDNLDFNFDGALFSLAKVPNKKDVLYQFKPHISKWVKVGNTGTTEIYTITIDSENLVIYAVDGGTLGTLNPVTAKFTKIGNIGGGTGTYGNKNINRVYGLTLDPVEKVLYATNRINTSEDILVKINPVNGKLIKKGFTNYAQKVDYVAVEASIVKATVNPSSPLTDVTCLLYEPITEQLLCLQRRFDKIALSRIGKSTGSLEEVIFDFSSMGIFLIDFDLAGNIYATTLNEMNSENGITQIDLGFGNINIFNPLSINEPDLQFVGLSFAKKIEIQNCKDEINLICSSPQLPLIKAKKAIYSSADLLINTTYKSGGEVSLHNYFNIPAHINFTVEIKDTCD